MNAAELIGIILENKLRVFTTSDIAMLCKIKRNNAAKVLERLSKKKIAFHLKRGIWSSNLLNVLPAEALSYLTSPWPSYVSLESALSEYGIINQVPIACHGVTVGKPFNIKTPLGEFRVHHIKKSLFYGYELKHSGAVSYFIAYPEKALLDTFYLRYRLGGTPNFKDYDFSLIDKNLIKKLVKPYPDRIKKLLSLALESGHDLLL